MAQKAHKLYRAPALQLEAPTETSTNKTVFPLGILETKIYPDKTQTNTLPGIATWGPQTPGWAGAWQWSRTHLPGESPAASRTASWSDSHSAGLGTGWNTPTPSWKLTPKHHINWLDWVVLLLRLLWPDLGRKVTQIFHEDFIKCYRKWQQENQPHLLSLQHASYLTCQRKS